MNRDSQALEDRILARKWFYEFQLPSAEALLWIMEKVGFQNVALVPPPPDAYEQFLSGKRVMAIGHVE